MRHYTHIVFSCLLVWTCVSAQPSLLTRKPSGAVNDFASVLSAGTARSLELLCTVCNEKTGVAIVVVTVESIEDGDIDETANRLYEAWGIGRKGADEGVLVLVAVGDRLVRIETGYGTEGYITDAQASDIIRTIAVPYFRQGNWDEGISGIVSACAQLAAREKGVPIEDILAGTSVRRYAGGERDGGRLGPLGGLFVLLAILFLLFTPAGRSMLPWILLFSMSGSRRSYGGGGFGRGFGGGGFGGGMSGGGGASGRW